MKAKGNVRDNVRCYPMCGGSDARHEYLTHENRSPPLSVYHDLPNTYWTPTATIFVLIIVGNSESQILLLPAEFSWNFVSCFKLRHASGE
jgi:hypothetical protein